MECLRPALRVDASWAAGGGDPEGKGQLLNKRLFKCGKYLASSSLETPEQGGL